MHKQDTANMDTCWGSVRGNHMQDAHQRGGISTTTQLCKTQCVISHANVAAVHVHLLRPQSQKVVVHATRQQQLKKRGPFLLLAGNRRTRAYHGTTLHPLPYTRSLKAAAHATLGGLGVLPMQRYCTTSKREAKLLWGPCHVSTGGVRQHLLPSLCHPA